MNKYITLLLLLIVSFTACRKKTEPPSLTSVLISKEWKVSFSRNYSSSYTSLFAGMKFTFKADGKLTVLDGTTAYNGTWSENPIAKTFNMEVVSPLFELDFASREWQVSSATFTGVNLKDDKTTTTQELRFIVW
jgi:hypothetical protein